MILVTIDTLRADRVGCYGDTGASTPNLDRLAREGIVLENAVTPVPITLPSHATMLTGLYPARHGIPNNDVYAMSPQIATLAERFREAGYRTGAFLSAFVLHRQFGLARGFDAYDDSLVTERAGTRTVGRALGWLESVGKRPFFVWIHLYEPHMPWTPPPPYLSLPLRSGYEKEVAAADGALGLLLERLGARGRLERAIVMVVSDHGEGLHDHGEMEHGVFLYRETTRVPWIVRLPGRQGAGTRLPDLVSTVDLAPTLCDLAGLKRLVDPDGSSLAAAFKGKPLPPREGVFLETVLPKDNYGWSPLLAFETPKWKWVRAPEVELYDLGRQPMEQENLATELPDTARSLDQKLEVYARQVRARGAAVNSVSPELAERLRSLGYVSAGDLASRDEQGLPDPKRMISLQGDLETAKRAMNAEAYRDALEPFRRVLAVNDQNMVALLGLGRALNRTGRYDEAESVHRRAVRLRPENPTAITGLADALFGLKQWGEASGLYRTSERILAQGPIMWARQAVCAAMRGNQPEAERCLSEAARAYPDQREYLATVQRELDDYRSLAASPVLPDTTRLREAAIAIRLGLVAAGQRILTHPLAARPNETLRLTLLGNLYITLDRPDLALTTLDRLMALDGRTPEREVRRAALLLQTRQLDQALSAYDKILAGFSLTRDRLAVVHYNRACVLSRMGRRAEALDALETAAGHGYGNARALLTDPDLDALREEPGFMALLNNASASTR